MTDVYVSCPVLEGERYLFRLICMDDAADLLSVYGDKLALPFFNSDNCHGTNFYCPTIESMREAIQGWLDAYRIKDFVRFSITDKAENRVIGTVELFHRCAEDAFDGVGVLRLDVGSRCEERKIIVEVLKVIIPPAFELFDCDTMIIKAPIYALERIAALEEYGFTKSNEHLIGHIDGFHYRDYWMINKNQMI